MIWYICFVITILILVRAVYVLIKNKSRFVSVKAFIYLLCASFAIYLPFFMSKLDVPGAVLNDVFNTMRMVSLDADMFESFREIAARTELGVFAGIYVVLLGILHLLVPIFGIITAYECIVNFFSNIRLRMINALPYDIYVFSEMNDFSLKLALDISENVGKKARFVFADTDDDKQRNSQLFSKHTFYKATSDKINLIDLKVKKSRELHFFNISPDSSDNINNTLRLAEKYITLPKEKQKQIHIHLFSDNIETNTIVDSMQKELLGIHVINTARMSIYNLFDEHPLFETADGKRISLLICGLNSVGEEALKAAVWLSQLVGVDFTINIADTDTESARSRLELRCPEIFDKEYKIRFYQTEFDDMSFSETLKNLSDTTYTVVCGENDEENISTALYLRRFFLKQDLSADSFPTIAAYIENYEKAQVVENLRTPESNPERRINYQIIPFGGSHSVYTYSSVMNSPIEKLSVNVHLAYEKIFSDGEINVLEAIERYNAFEVNKSSNRANALHIRYKLWLLGLDYTDDEDAEEINFNEYLTEEKLREMTLEEHDRWMAFLRTEGWTVATLEQAQTYMSAGLSKGRHNCPLLLMHPYICDFDELEYISEKLSLPDATKYDIELIRMIPEILSNSTVNKCGYKIVKRKI